MSEKAYQPREYKTFASAKRAGRRECMKRGIISYSVYRLWSNILVVGHEEQRKWNAYVIEHEIPIMRDECYTVYVWQAWKKDQGNLTQRGADPISPEDAEYLESMPLNPDEGKQ